MSGRSIRWLSDTGRVEYVPILDDEALEAFQLTDQASRASSRRWNPPTPSPMRSSSRRLIGKDQIVIVNLSGRGDKDVHTVAKMLGMEI